MTGKLMKYEMRSMLRTFLPLWGAILVVALLNRFTLKIDNLTTMLHGIPATLLIILYVLGIMAIAIVALVFMIQRFYNGLLKDEGYLMFTLPVKTSQLIWAKCLSAVILAFVTTLICIASLLVMLLESDFIREIGDGFRWFFELGASPAEKAQFQELLGVSSQVLLLTLVWGFFSTITSVMQAYLAMAIGQLANKHRAGWAVLSYIGITILLQTVGITGLVNNFWNIDDKLSNYFQSLSYSGMVWVVFGVLILIELVQIAIFYFPTHAILKNKLNLE